LARLPDQIIFHNGQWPLFPSYLGVHMYMIFKLNIAKYVPGTTYNHPRYASR